MIQKFSLLALAAGSLFAGAVAASGDTLDFTDTGSYDTQTASAATGNFLGIDWTVTSNPADLLSYTAYDGTGGTSPLANDNDGIGVGDDEVTRTDPPEQLIITFARTVILDGIHLLDMYAAPNFSTLESVKIFNAAHVFITEIFADTTFGGGYDGYVTKTFAPLIGKTFIFEAGAGNDTRGRPDFSLAGLQVVPENTGDVPLPAGGVLLLTALAGLGLARRRAKD